MSNLQRQVAQGTVADSRRSCSEPEHVPEGGGEAVERGALELWGSVLSSLECVYVARGLKRACIGFLSPGKLDRLREYCRVRELAYVTSDYKLRSIMEPDKGGFANKSIKVPLESPEGDLAVFVARTEDDARVAKYYYGVGDHIKTGMILGYPACCTRFFVDKHNSARNLDLIWHTARDTRPHSFLNNRAMRYFGISLISHFPCSLDCSASKGLAAQRLRLLEQEYPDIARRFEMLLKSVVIYTENWGIFFANDYVLNGRNVRFQGLRGTVDNDLFKSLRDVGELTIESPNCLLVGQERIEGDACVLLFA